MGCDIHFYVEAWDDHAKRWVAQDKVSKEDGEFSLTEQFGDYAYKARGGMPSGAYVMRNYTLFSVLANVRQIDEHPIPFITDQRGIPDDLSPELQEIYNPQSDDHSHTWMTLKEVLDWPHWNVTYKQGTTEFNDDKVTDKQTIKTIREWCDTFWERSIPKLKKLRKNPADVRLVMWFDN